jgi:hypothetical protein
MMATQLRTNDVFHGIPDDALITDADECAFYAQDVFTKGPQPLAVLRPGSIDELSRGVGQATSAGIAVIPRCGGFDRRPGPNEPHHRNQRDGHDGDGRSRCVLASIV